MSSALCVATCSCRFVWWGISEVWNCRDIYGQDKVIKPSSLEMVWKRSSIYIVSPYMSVTNSSTTWELKSSLAVCEDQCRVEMWNSDCGDCSVAQCFPCCTTWDRHQNSWCWWHRLSLWLEPMTLFCTNCKSFCWLQCGSCRKTVKRNRTFISEVMIILTLLSKWWQYFTSSNFMQQILTWRPKEDFEEWISDPACCLVRLKDSSGNHQVLSHCSEQGHL